MFIFMQQICDSLSAGFPWYPDANAYKFLMGV